MAAFHSFTTTTLLTIVFRLLCLSLLLQLTGAAPTLLLTAHLPRDDSSSSTPSAHVLVSINSSSSSSPFLANPHLTHQLVRREKYILATDADGNLQAISEGRRTPIPQAPASDGAGAGFDAPAIIWLGFSAVIGLPMLGAGLKLGRIASGAGMGCAAMLLAWTSIINTMSEVGLSDLILTIVSLGFFLGGSAFGCLRICNMIAPPLIALLGGLAVGVRLVLLRAGLLIPGEGGYPANWGVIAVCGIMGIGFVFWKKTQRGAVAFGCASIGAFLSGLALDLIISRQAGMSRGLRVLFDRNSSHIVDLILRPYRPSITTQVLVGISLALTPIAAYAQWRFFPGPFLQSSSARFRDPTMGRFVSETETLPDHDNDSKVPDARPRPPANVNNITSLRSSVVSWFRRDNLPAPGRPEAAAAYESNAGGARMHKASPLARGMGNGSLRQGPAPGAGIEMRQPQDQGYGHARGGSRVMNALGHIRTLPRRS